MPDLSQVPTAQLQQMLASAPSKATPVIPNSPTPAQPGTSEGTDLSKIPTDQLQQMLTKAPSKPKDTDVPSKLLAMAGAASNEMLRGAGKTIEAVPNLFAQGINHTILAGLNKAGLISDSTLNTIRNKTTDFRQSVENIGDKILDFQRQPAQADITANPTLSKYAGLAGNIVGSSLAAGGIVGKLGRTLNPVLGQAVNQGAQGALMGASANADHPFRGALIGGTVGAVGGAIAGKLDRSAQIINDKLDDAARVGESPYSEASVKSIKGALDNNGKEITTEEIEKKTMVAVQKKLDSVAPKVDLSQSPADMIVNTAKGNFTEVRNTKNALYQPLNDSKAVAPTPTLNTALSTIKDQKAIKMLPQTLQPTGTSLSDLMAYRKQISNAGDQAALALKKGSTSVTYQTVQDLNTVKDAVTQDIATAADKVGLSGQLQKADSFYRNQYMPFKVYNPKTGTLMSDEDISSAWGNVSKLLKGQRINGDTLTKLKNIMTTLGPQGKQITGYAYLQQAIKNASNVDGRVFPAKLSAAFNKLNNTGLADHILTPEVMEAFNGAEVGLRAIAEGAVKTTKGSSTPSSGAIISIVNGLTHNSAGIGVLRLLGSKTMPQSKIKNIFSQLLLNATEKQAASPQ